MISLKNFENNVKCSVKNRASKKMLYVLAASFLIQTAVAHRPDLHQDISDKNMNIFIFTNKHTQYLVEQSALSTIHPDELGRRLIAFNLGAISCMPAKKLNRTLYKKLPNLTTEHIKLSLAFTIEELKNSENLNTHKYNGDGGDSVATRPQTRYVSSKSHSFSIDEVITNILIPNTDDSESYRLYDVCYLAGQLFTHNINIQQGDNSRIFNITHRPALAQILNYILSLDTPKLQAFSNVFNVVNTEISESNAPAAKFRNALSSAVAIGSTNTSLTSLSEFLTLAQMNFKSSSTQSVIHSFASWNPKIGYNDSISLANAIDFGIYSHRLYGNNAPLTQYVKCILMQLIKDIKTTVLDNPIAKAQQAVIFAPTELNAYSFNEMNLIRDYTGGLLRDYTDLLRDLNGLISKPGRLQGMSINDIDHKEAHLKANRIALAWVSSTERMVTDKYDHLMHKPKGSSKDPGKFEYYVDQLNTEVDTIINTRAQNISLSSFPSNQTVIITGNSFFDYQMSE